MKAPMSTAVQRINYPVHQGRPNPSHGKYMIVGSVPAACYDVQKGRSMLYDTERQALDAVISAGATQVQRADCSWEVRT